MLWLSKGALKSRAEFLSFRIYHLELFDLGQLTYSSEF